MLCGTSGLPIPGDSPVRSWLVAMTRDGDGGFEDESSWDDYETPVSPPNNRKESDTERQCELLAMVKKREIRLISLIVCLLALVTLYFAVLNVVIILKREAEPYTLALNAPAGMPGEARYALSVFWEPMAGSKEETIRPRLMLDGQRQLPDHLSSEEAAPSIDLKDGHRLGIDVPEECTSGEHKGSIVLDKIAGHESLPEQHKIPVFVAVTGGIWHSWFLLRNWLLFLVVVAVLLYFFCLVKYPLPKGKLLFYNSLDGIEAPTRLPRQRRSWVFPWLRSTVPLGKIVTKAGMPRPWRMQASIDFLLPNMPVLVLYSGIDRKRIVRVYLDSTFGLDGVAKEAECSVIELMSGSGSVFGYEITSPENHEYRGSVRFQYKS